MAWSPWRTTFGFNEPYNADGKTPAWPGGPSHHRGIDLALPGPDNGRGTAYGAFQPGVVVELPNESAGGLGIKVRTNSGLFNYYGHNDRVLVDRGDRVDRGDLIGTLGRTGLEGPGPRIQSHLHYEVRRNSGGDPVGSTINPVPYMRAHALGGVIAEPSLLVNRQGRAWGTIAEDGPELVTSAPRTAAMLRGGAGGAGISRTDLDHLADRIVRGVGAIRHVNMFTTIEDQARRVGAELRRQERDQRNLRGRPAR